MSISTSARQQARPARCPHPVQCPSVARSAPRPRTKWRCYRGCIGAGFGGAIFVHCPRHHRNEIDEGAASMWGRGGQHGDWRADGWALDTANSKPRIRFDASLRGTNESQRAACFTGSRIALACHSHIVRHRRSSVDSTDRVKRPCHFGCSGLRPLASYRSDRPASGVPESSQRLFQHLVATGADATIAAALPRPG